jgi:transcriptional regulator with XRE-family HTH domain
VERRDDLADFLRARRAAVSPADAGLPEGPRRRTPGLRREEVAMLAGVSVTWYTWLEQGCPINASADVLDALARTLRLSGAERAHLHTLAERTVPPSPAAGEVGAAEVGAGAPVALERLVESLEPQPAYVLGSAWQFLAWNPAQARLFPDLGTLPEPERNLLWLVFAVPAIRRLIVDWPNEARRMLAEFRADTAARRDRPEIAGLVDRLKGASPEFATWWADHDVAQFTTRLRHFQHPRAGRLVFEFQQLTPVEWPDLKVVCQLSVPGDDSAARLANWHEAM